MPDGLKETCSCGATLELEGFMPTLALAAQEWREGHLCEGIVERDQVLRDRLEE